MHLLQYLLNFGYIYTDLNTFIHVIVWTMKKEVFENNGTCIVM